jgi:hypothetical protein
MRDNTGQADAEKKDFTYTHDTNGNLLQITDTQPGAKVSDYVVSYNGLNQVAKVEEKKGTAGCPSAPAARHKDRLLVAVQELVADWSDGPPATWNNHSLPDYLEAPPAGRSYRRR